jgi:hypothetical protein
MGTRNHSALSFDNHHKQFIRTSLHIRTLHRFSLPHHTTHTSEVTYLFTTITEVLIRAGTIIRTGTAFRSRIWTTSEADATPSPGCTSQF